MLFFVSVENKKRQVKWKQKAGHKLALGYMTFKSDCYTKQLNIVLKNGTASKNVSVKNVIHTVSEVEF